MSVNLEIEDHSLCLFWMVAERGVDSSGVLSLEGLTDSVTFTDNGRTCDLATLF